jgi:hypothetical protein
VATPVEEPPPAAEAPLPPLELPPDPEPTDTDDIIEADPDLDARYSQAKRMAIAGGITMGVGFLISLSLGTTLAYDSRVTDVTPPGAHPVYTGAWATFGVGVTALIAGSVVMAIGLAKRRRVIDEAESRLGSYARVAPWFGKRSAGLGLTLRY